VEQNLSLKAQLTTTLNEQMLLLGDISQTFKYHNDTLLYESTENKIKLFLSMLDNIELQYYDKLQHQIDDIIHTVSTLQNAEQKDDL